MKEPSPPTHPTVSEETQQKLAATMQKRLAARPPTRRSKATKPLSAKQKREQTAKRKQAREAWLQERYGSRDARRAYIEMRDYEERKRTESYQDRSGQVWLDKDTDGNQISITVLESTGQHWAGIFHDVIVSTAEGETFTVQLWENRLWDENPDMRRIT